MLRRMQQSRVMIHSLVVVVMVVVYLYGLV